MSKPEEQSLIEQFRELLAQHSESVSGVQSWQYLEQKKFNEEVLKRFDNIEEKLQPIIEFMSTARGIKKGFLWLSALLLAITACFYSLKEIIGYFGKIK